LTGDQKHRDHIATGQQVNRHSSQPEVFYFFSHRTFLKTILASRTSGTFGFAPTHKADPPAKPKEPLFSQRTYNNNKLDTNNMLKKMFNILHLLKVEFISLTH
jgi:hypothetical protein